MSWLKPRTRTMPLVPEPFPDITLATQSIAFGSTPMAKTWCQFCPNLNIPQYREGLSDEKKTELNQRAMKLLKSAINNRLYSSSEFGWEISAWHNVFSFILDDERFRVDKRPYEFIEENETEEQTVKIRIPDATMGLKSYDEYFFKRRFVCEVPDCKDDHSEMVPDERLSQRALKDMMHNKECGLIVDGLWGKTDLVFPFAVYEAKKSAASLREAEDQIHHACRTYLAMLDDLARDPDNIAEYQTKESSMYQLFAFVSCGSMWQVSVAWNMLGACTVEPIWQGDVKSFTSAFDLICIVDQIYDYAINRHRPFVMKHLEAWHARHARHGRTSEPLERPFGDVDSEVLGASDLDYTDASESDEENGYIDSIQSQHGYNELDGLFIEYPKWYYVKQRSLIFRIDRAGETRINNRKLRTSRPVNDLDQEPERNLGQGLSTKSPAKTEETTKRGRGRPRKAETVEKESRKQRQGNALNAGVTKSVIPKRGRGRPRKVLLAKQELPKRGRGRPRKIIS